MPVIQIYMLEGRTPTQKKKIVEGITKVMENEANTKRESVIVVINEVPTENYATAGTLMSDRVGG